MTDAQYYAQWVDMYNLRWWPVDMYDKYCGVDT